MSPLEQTWADKPGILGWLSTVDHKRIGLRFVVTTLVFFALAGLLQTTSSRDVAQFPWIGSVPVLGALFRSAAFRQQETDLVVIVTPRLIAPAVPGQRLGSPLDARLPSNDVDFFLNGQPEVRKLYEDFVTSGGELKGPYGHMIDPSGAAGFSRGAK